MRSKFNLSIVSFGMASLLAASLSTQVFACTAGNANVNIAELSPTADWTDHGNQTVTHAKTSLMWKQCVQGLSGAGCATGTATTHTWSEALNLAVADNTAGYSDWRLPNFKELQSIQELCGHTPAINQTIFPATVSNNYWASTPNLENGNPTAWMVDFALGTAKATESKASSKYVRLVRNADTEIVSAFDTLAPELSDIKAIDVTKTAATISVTSDTDDNAYIIRVAKGSTVPTREQVKARVTYAGVTIEKGDVATLIAGGVYTLLYDPLATATEFDLYLVAHNALDNAHSFVEHLRFNTYQDPDDFSFVDKTGVAVNTLVESDPLTVSGLTVKTNISIANGEYRIGTGDYTSAAGEVSNGEDVQVRHTSSDINIGTIETTLTIGEKSAVFRSITVSDSTPDQFRFTDRTHVAYQQIITSDEIIVRDVAISLPISVVGGEYSVNGAAFTASAGTVNLGDSVAVRLVSASTGLETTEVTLTIGSISDTFSVTTDVDTDGDGVPNRFDDDDDNDGVKDVDDLNPLDPNIGAATNTHGQEGGGSVGLWYLLLLGGVILLRRRAPYRC